MGSLPGVLVTLIHHPAHRPPIHRLQGDILTSVLYLDNISELSATLPVGSFSIFKNSNLSKEQLLNMSYGNL